MDLFFLLFEFSPEIKLKLLIKLALSLPGSLQTNHLMVLVEKLVEFVLQSDDFLILSFLVKSKLLEKCRVLGVGDHYFFLGVLFFFDVFLEGLFLLDKLLNLFTHFLFLELIKINAIYSIYHDLLEPVIVFDNLDDFMLLIRSDDRENLTNYHLYQSRVVLDQLILQLMLIQLRRLSLL